MGHMSSRAHRPYRAGGAAPQEPIGGLGGPGSHSRAPRGPTPLSVRVTAELRDGTTRGWADVSRGDDVARALRGCGAVFVWTDVAGTPQRPGDVDVLRGLPGCRALAEGKWGESLWAEGRAREPDELRVLAGEECVALRLAVVLAGGADAANGSPRSSRGDVGGDDSLQHPDRLHANLFDVGEDDDLGVVWLLCFPDGIVTWRPVPEVEGWKYIEQAVARRHANADCTERRLTTSYLLHVILEEICEAFLPDPASVLNEVDAIDSMMPLVRRRESDQADVLRRALRLQQRLSVHRRLLLSKVNILEQLGRPLMRTLLAFVTADLGGTGGALHQPNVFATCRALGNMPANADGCCALVARPHSPHRTSILSRVLHLLRQLDSARTTLGNATIVYTSTVAMRNNSSSNESDYRIVVLQYILLIVLPLTIVTSQWGMNCLVPWQELESTIPFWSITGIGGAYAFLLLVYPIYCWATGRPDKLVF